MQSPLLNIESIFVLRESSKAKDVAKKKTENPKQAHGLSKEMKASPKGESSLERVRVPERERVKEDVLRAAQFELEFSKKE